jgi:biopolymer transport protein ExbB/TolQ
MMPTLLHILSMLCMFPFLLTKKRGVAQRQRRIRAIRTYVRRGYSSRTIQRKLQKRHLGIRRQVLLREIRKARRVRAKPRRERYVPRKYRTRLAVPVWERRARRRISVGYKHVTLEGFLHGKRKRKVLTGSGRTLYTFVRNEIGKVGEKDGWDSRPRISS